MPDDFENRMREAVVVPTDVELDHFREATKSAAGSLGSADALDLVRVAHGRGISEEADARLRRRFNSKESVIAERGEAQLLATLSAITLIRVFGRPQYLPGLLPALAVRAARNCGWTPVHPDLRTHADGYVRGRARLVRLPLPAESFQQQAKEGGSPDPMGEVRALRNALLGDRALREENERLLWWLTSRYRPRSAVDAAIEFANLLGCIPEPIASGELLQTKLSRAVPDDSASSWVFAPPAIPPDLADLCVGLAAGRADGRDFEVDQVHGLVNEILLIRALQERPIDQ